MPPASPVTKRDSQGPPRVRVVPPWGLEANLMVKRAGPLGTSRRVRVETWGKLKEALGAFKSPPAKRAKARVAKAAGSGQVEPIRPIRPERVGTRVKILTWDPTGRSSRPWPPVTLSRVGSREPGT